VVREVDDAPRESNSGAPRGDLARAICDRRPFGVSQMISLIVLIVAVGAIADAARKRGASSWAFGTVAVLGYLIVGSALSTSEAMRGPAILVSWAWLGACYGAVFLFTQGGRRLNDSWQCPECQLFNEPTTFFCACGYQHPMAEESMPQESKVACEGCGVEVDGHYSLIPHPKTSQRVCSICFDRSPAELAALAKATPPA